MLQAAVAALPAWQENRRENPAMNCGAKYLACGLTAGLDYFAGAKICG
jgi:hypothetical protein